MEGFINPVSICLFSIAGVMCMYGCFCMKEKKQKIHVKQEINKNEPIKLNSIHIENPLECAVEVPDISKYSKIYKFAFPPTLPRRLKNNSMKK